MRPRIWPYSLMSLLSGSQFLKGILYEMLLALIIDRDMTLEINTVKEFMVKTRAYKSSIKTVTYYIGHNCNYASHSRPVVHR